MSLASYEDANAHLDETKIGFASAADAEDKARSADAIVKAKLGDRFPDYVALWSDTVPNPNPNELIATPALVREAASLLMAAFLYEERYSEETLDDNDYAARLQKRAMFLLDGIADGSLILWDVDYGQDANNTARLEREDFWPNDTYTPELVALERSLGSDLSPRRMFGMDADF